MEQHEHNDEELLRLVVGGDSKAFNKLYDKYVAAVFNVGMKYLADKALAEDLVQEVFGKLWKNRANFGGVEIFQAYFFTIVRHDAVKKIKQLAHERMTKEKYAQQADRSDNNVEAHLLHIDQVKMINLFVGNLPLPHQRVFNLVKLKGFDRTAVAEQLELSQQTVDNYLVLALKELRKHLRHILMPPYWVALVLSLFGVV
jgi:RNA polymerase sigma-70 factor (family 1)